MRTRALLLVVVLPLLEITLFVRFAAIYGWEYVAYLALATAVGGFILARLQGIGTLRRMQVSLAEGRLPGSDMLDGILILVCGALLILPGFLTDVAGLIGLIPPVRQFVRMRLETRWIGPLPVGGATTSVKTGEGRARGQHPAEPVVTGRPSGPAQRDISAVVERFQRPSEAGS